MTDAIERIIEARQRDLGDGFVVRRLLPVAGRRAVGPFVFLDHMGPVAFAPGQGLDVRPHPHIGLATVTYLFEGEILHRDSLGSQQAIRPGDVNWMVAGRGIVHSERTAPALRAAGHRLEGLQSWVALPAAAEETDPDFRHHPAAALPSWESAGARLTLVLGSAYGRQAPAAIFSPLFYLAAELIAGASLELPSEYADRALYVVKGTVTLGGATLGPGQLAVVKPGAAGLRAATSSRVMLLGGEPLPEARTIWWNFVSSRPPRIEQAKADWKAGRFPAVPGDDEFIALPEA
jgi:redox-sensitive bicupin YhaK (pirin superfamily)